MINFRYSAYNFRRYGRPWGAVITFNGSKASYDFSAADFLAEGTRDSVDNGGEVVINCNPGDIIATGQKDYRKPQKSDNSWYIVDDTGTDCISCTQPEALKYYISRQKKEGV